MWFCIDHGSGCVIVDVTRDMQYHKTRNMPAQLKIENMELPRFWIIRYYNESFPANSTHS